MYHLHLVSSSWVSQLIKLPDLSIYIIYPPVVGFGVGKQHMALVAVPNWVHFTLFRVILYGSVVFCAEKESST
jgi:hypothetical protein